VRGWFALALLIVSLVRPAAGLAAETSRGLAVTDPLTLRELDLRERREAATIHPGFGLHQMLDPSGPAPLRGDRLFALPSMAEVKAALDDEIARARSEQLTTPPRPRVGAGAASELQLFDRDRLVSSATQFILAGIVNRMDRGYAAADGCGEIRLIYRPVHDTRDSAAPRRLPMTLNLVLRAGGDGTVSCRELARRWTAVEDWTESGAALALKLLGPDGPLAPLRRDDILRLELNLQLAHLPQAAPAESRTDYLMKTFRYDPAAQRFREGPLENQIDRDRLLADHALGRAFKHWILSPGNLAAFDRGTALVPEQFLARRVVAAAPAAFTRTRDRPATGLAGPGTRDPLLSDADIVAALQRAADSDITLQSIRSPAGFERRLNDITCAGCHQTRGIGGFHFPGVDWSADAAHRSPAAPGSPHFLDDQSRRRGIVAALRDGKMPDYARGFADRPGLRDTTESADAAEKDGWGAHCGLAGAGAAPDPSFRNWNCAAGLSCQPARGGATFPIGMCFVGER
jgi:hypothetical protein